MKILLEASVLQRKYKTGVDYFTREIFNALLPKMQESIFLLAYFEKADRIKGLSFVNVKKIPIGRLSPRVYRILFRLGVAPNYDKLVGKIADIAIFPNFVSWPLGEIKKSVTIIYDTAYLDKPQFVTSRLRKYLKKFVPKAIKNSTHIVTISGYSKKSLIKHYGIDKKNVSVINPAVDHNRFYKRTSSEIKIVKKKYGISKDYLLYVGTLEPRKNIAGIIDAYNSLPERTKLKFGLVLAGGKGWLDDEIQLKIDTSEGVKRIGYVDEADLPALYSGAKLFLYPSFYEGWGMQIIESMACGTPVITSNNSSLNEAGGDFATYIDPLKIDSIANAIISLLGNEKLLHRKSLAGINYAKSFTWEKSASKLKKVLELIAG